MIMKHIWVCLCGCETECGPEDFRLGAVFQCPDCKSIFGCVKPIGGGAAWVPISLETAKFNHLINDEEEENTEENTKNSPTQKWDIIIEALELSVRTGNILRTSGIRTVGQLMELDESEIRALPHAGAKTVKEIIEVRENLASMAKK